MRLRELIIKAHMSLDPNCQAIIWPDPIKWDGRPLYEQAADLVVLLDERGIEPELSAELDRRARRAHRQAEPRGLRGKLARPHQNEVLR